MNEKELIKRLFVCLIIILACYFAFAYIGTRKDVHDNGYGANHVRNELRNAEEAQREEKRTIERTERAITRGKQAVDESTRTNKSIEKLERKDAEIIAECQSILARVRKRTATED